LCSFFVWLWGVPQAGNKVCYSRAYDAAHMKARPQQRITAMKFLLSVAAYDPKPAGAATPEDLYYYTFAMSVSRRQAVAAHVGRLQRRRQCSLRGRLRRRQRYARQDAASQQPDRPAE
jgi:hypothetical protein